MRFAGGAASQIDSSRLGRRVAFAALNAISFAVPDFVASSGRQRALRWAIRATAIAWSVPSIRRVLSQMRVNWRRLACGVRDSPQALKAAAGIGSGMALTVGSVAWLLHRLLEGCVHALARRGVRYPRLAVGVTSETVSVVLSARLRRRVKLARQRRSASPAGPAWPKSSTAHHDLRSRPWAQASSVRRFNPGVRRNTPS